MGGANLEAVLSDFRAKAGPDSTSRRFEQLDVDSFDLMVLRVDLETALGRAIPDDVWLGFDRLDDVSDYLASAPPPVDRVGQAAEWIPQMTDGVRGLEAPDDGEAFDRAIRLNMPGMAVGGLSEGWLFRELGDLHWHELCRHLNTLSDAITDEDGARLYATFVRFRWECPAHLRRFFENETLRISAKLQRLGRSMIVNDTRVRGEGKELTAQLMTTFAAREGEGNTALRKTSPIGMADSAIEALTERPQLSTEYHQARNGEPIALRLGDHEVALTDDVLWSTPYAINPYYEINGVNLLYFASYPLISDACERAFVRSDASPVTPTRDWAIEASTVARDVLYFGNCDIDDSIVYEQNRCDRVGERQVALVSTLRRASDRAVLSRVVTVKEHHG